MIGLPNMLNTREKLTVRIDAIPARRDGGFRLKLRKGRALQAPSELRDLGVRRKSRWWGLVFILIGMAPTIAAGVYLAAFSQERYVSVASFVVRTASKPAGSAGFGALLQMAGFSRSDDDVFSIQDFMRSREAAAKLGQ